MNPRFVLWLLLSFLLLPSPFVRLTATHVLGKASNYQEPLALLRLIVFLEFALGCFRIIDLGPRPSQGCFESPSSKAAAEAVVVGSFSSLHIPPVTKNHPSSQLRRTLSFGILSDAKCKLSVFTL